MKPSLIVGLGNPGLRYKDTRHNIGFDVIDIMIPDASFRKEKKFLYVHSGDVYLIKPTTYMNLSGSAVLSALSKFGCEVSRIMIVCDDFSLPLGKIRFRLKGSSGGHNGLESIIEKVGPEFPRLRIGVGPLPERIDPSEFVLGRFRDDEDGIKSEVVRGTADIIKKILASGFTIAASWTIRRRIS